MKRLFSLAVAGAFALSAQAFTTAITMLLILFVNLLPENLAM